MRTFNTILHHMRLKLAFYSMLAFFFALLVERIPLGINVFAGLISFSFLNIGANLFNDYYDRDHGPLVGLEVPARITNAVIISAWAFKIAGFIVALFYTSTLFTMLYVLGVIASFVYSHKKVRAKSNPVLSVIFGIGSGSAIFLAGSLVDGLQINLNFILGLVASGLFLSSLHIITQIYETKEDSKRHDNTLAIIYGKKFALIVSLIFFLLAGVSIFYILQSFYLNVYLLSFIVLYFIIFAVFMLNWIRKEPESDKKDYNLVRYFIPFSTLIAYVVIVILYLHKVVNIF